MIENIENDPDDSGQIWKNMNLRFIFENQLFAQIVRFEWLWTAVPSIGQ